LINSYINVDNIIKTDKPYNQKLTPGPHSQNTDVVIPSPWIETSMVPLPIKFPTPTFVNADIVMKNKISEQIKIKKIHTKEKRYNFFLSTRLKTTHKKMRKQLTAARTDRIVIESIKRSGKKASSPPIN